MTLGEGIFWSTVLILIAFFLYQISVKKKWKTVGKVFVILVLVGVLIGGGFWGWNVYELRPRIMDELDGIRFGMSPLEVKLVKGAPTREGEVVEREKDAGEKFKMTWIYKQNEFCNTLLIIFSGNERNALRASIICDDDIYSKIFGLNKYDSEETVIKKLGIPSHESIHSDGLQKAISYEQWKVGFEIEKGNVTRVCVSESGKLTFANEYGEESAIDTPSGLTEAEELELLELELLESQSAKSRWKDAPLVDDP